MIGSRSKKLGNQIKIIDFGLAKYYANGKFVNNKRVGKTGYMAPEVFAKKQYDPRAADIWSLGVMLFMMLIGAPPYQLPSPSNPAFNFIVNGRLRDVLKHWKRLRCVNKDALDLLNKIFKYESKRISMDEILKHPFVNLQHAKKEEASNPLKSTTQTPSEPPQQQQQQQQQQQPAQSEQSEPSQQESQPQPQAEQAEQETKPKEVKQEQKVTPQPQDFDNYSFRSEVAKKLLARLNTNEANRSMLTQIMKEIEQTHKSLGDKLRQNSNKDAGNNNSSDKLQQTINELHIINSMVEQRLASTNKPKVTHHN
jgi:serine/threonine protein kinase